MTAASRTEAHARPSPTPSRGPRARPKASRPRLRRSRRPSRELEWQRTSREAPASAQRDRRSAVKSQTDIAETLPSRRRVRSWTVRVSGPVGTCGWPLSAPPSVGLLAARRGGRRARPGSHRGRAHVVGADALADSRRRSPARRPRHFSRSSKAVLRGSREPGSSRRADPEAATSNGFDLGSIYGVVEDISIVGLSTRFSPSVSFNTSETPTDGEFVRRARRGDESAFGRLVRAVSAACIRGRVVRHRSARGCGGCGSRGLLWWLSTAWRNVVARNASGDGS
jgi:hypothetical protein